MFDITQASPTQETQRMNMQVTSKVAKVGSHLAALGQRHKELEDRIANVERQPQPDALVVKRLKRQKLRLKDQMQHCEGVLRTLSRSLA